MSTPPVQNSILMTVNDSDGKTASIIINRSGPGWVGPDGTFFTVFPSQQKVQELYGR